MGVGAPLRKGLTNFVGFVILTPKTRFMFIVFL